MSPDVSSSENIEACESSETSECLGLEQPELRKTILCVGLCRTDIVQICREFPEEYSEFDCLECRWQRGGNASNTCTVLTQCDVPVEFLGTLSDEEPKLHDLICDMDEHRIDHSHCRTIPNTISPISSIVVNESNLSRTIWNYNPNLPELTMNEFNKLDLSNYSWIHFEGRNVSNVVHMMRAIKNFNMRVAKREIEDRLAYNPIIISVEVHKEIPDMCQLLPFADVVFIGEKFINSKGSNSMTLTLDFFNGVEVKPGAIIICAYDERGALGRAPNGERIQCPPKPPNSMRQIVDIFGANDTFNAAVIYYLYQEYIHFVDQWNEPIEGEQSHLDSTRPLEFIDPTVLYQALCFACRLSGAKMEFRGFRQLNNMYERLTIHDDDNNLYLET